MLVPKPMLDETVHSHLIRIQRLNCIDTLDKTIKRLMCHVGSKADGAAHDEVWRLLARASGIDEQAYLCQHTRIPFVNVVRSHRSYTDSLGGFDSSRSLRYCRQCSEHDVVVRGYSYWRRLHQILGVEYCPIHRQLLEIAQSVDMETTLPCQVMGQVGEFVRESRKVYSNSIAERYTVLIGALLCGGYTVEPCAASFELVSKAISGPKSESRGKQFSEACNAVLGYLQANSGDWHSMINLDNHGNLIPTVWRGTEAYALLGAVLYDSPTAALDGLFQMTSHGQDSNSGLSLPEFWASETAFRWFVGLRGVDACRSEIDAGPVIRIGHQASLRAPAAVGLDLASDGFALRDFLRGAPLDDSCKRYGADSPRIRGILKTGVKEAQRYNKHMPQHGYPAIPDKSFELQQSWLKSNSEEDRSDESVLLTSV